MNRSPLHHHLESLGADFEENEGWLVSTFEARAPGHGVALIDASHRGRVRVEGPDAAKTVKANGLGVGEGASLKGGEVFCSRPDLFFILGATSVPKTKKKSWVDCREMTHGSAEIWVVGPQATRLLSRVCGLDFRDFPNRHLKSSSVAKTTQHVFRRDFDGITAFALVGPASLAVYLWRTLTEAAHGLDLRILDSKVLP